MRERYLNKSVRVMDELIDSLKETNQAQHQALILYDYLISLRNNNTRYAICSYNKLRNKFGYSKSTIIKCIDFLEEYGFLFILKEPYKTNKYFMPLEDSCLNPDKMENYETIIRACNGDINKWYEYIDNYLTEFRKEIAI